MHVYLALLLRVLGEEWEDVEEGDKEEEEEHRLCSRPQIWVGVLCLTADLGLRAS